MKTVSYRDVYYNVDGKNVTKLFFKDGSERNVEGIQTYRGSKEWYEGSFFFIPIWCGVASDTQHSDVLESVEITKNGVSEICKIEYIPGYKR